MLIPVLAAELMARSAGTVDTSAIAKDCFYCCQCWIAAAHLGSGPALQPARAQAQLNAGNKQTISHEAPSAASVVVTGSRDAERQCSTWAFCHKHAGAFHISVCSCTAVCDGQAPACAASGEPSWQPSWHAGQPGQPAPPKPAALQLLLWLRPGLLAPCLPLLEVCWLPQLGLVSLLCVGQLAVVWLLECAGSHVKASWASCMRPASVLQSLRPRCLRQSDGSST